MARDVTTDSGDRAAFTMKEDDPHPLPLLVLCLRHSETGGLAMTRERDIAFTPAYELNRMVRAKEVSPVELTEISLRRI